MSFIKETVAVVLFACVVMGLYGPPPKYVQPQEDREPRFEFYERRFDKCQPKCGSYYSLGHDILRVMEVYSPDNHSSTPDFTFEKTVHILEDNDTLACTYPVSATRDMMGGVEVRNITSSEQDITEALSYYLNTVLAHQLRADNLSFGAGLVGHYLANTILVGYTGAFSDCGFVFKGMRQVQYCEKHKALERWPWISWEPMYAVQGEMIDIDFRYVTQKGSKLPISQIEGRGCEKPLSQRLKGDGCVWYTNRDSSECDR